MASFVYEIRFLDVNEQYLVLNFFFLSGGCGRKVFYNLVLKSRWLPRNTIRIIIPCICPGIFCLLRFCGQLHLRD